MPLCCICARLKDFELGEYDRVIAHCEAYPDGIPEAVIYAGHIYPKPNDNGLQFISREAMPYGAIKEVEDDEYRELEEYYKELNMSDEEWIIKTQNELKISYKEAKLMLPFRMRRENEPKKW